MRTIRTIVIAASLAAALAGCTNPYDPGQRALGGAAIGAGGGALIGGALGGGRGALTGALIGGAAGAVTGVATTPQPPAYRDGGYYQERRGPYEDRRNPYEERRGPYQY